MLKSSITKQGDSKGKVVKSINFTENVFGQLFKYRTMIPDKNIIG